VIKTLLVEIDKWIPPTGIPAGRAVDENNLEVVGNREITIIVQA